MKNAIMIFCLSTLLIIVVLSCKKKLSKSITEIEFSFEPCFNMGYKYESSSVCYNLKVLLKYENTVFYNCFKGIILKDGHKYYLLYPEKSGFMTVEEDDIIWYKFLFFDLSLSTNEVVENYKYMRLDSSDSLNYIKQTMSLKMEKKFIVKNERYYIFSQSFGSNYYRSNDFIKHLRYYQKHLDFVHFYFLFSEKSGFIYLPHMLNRRLMYRNHIPYSKDNYWMFGDTTTNQMIN